jgi:hypothetical protein
MAEGAERVLEMLVSSDLSDEAWLRSIVAFGELNARPTHAVEPHHAALVAVILFGPSP